MKKNTSIQKTRKRIRSKVKGTSECPRLAVFRSNSHIYAQIIDDVTGNTLVSCSTMDKEVKDKISVSNNCEASSFVGEVIAKRSIHLQLLLIQEQKGA